MKDCNGFGNIIKHISEHDGTVRSARACFIIKNTNPKNAKEMADFILKNRNKESKTIYDKQFPIFFEDKKLVDYCKSRNKPDWVNYCVSHVDLVDISADVWKLSPIIREKYSKSKTITSPHFGTATFEGWHDFLRDVRKELKGMFH